MSSVTDQARQLIDEVQRQLADGDAQLRSLGFNPDKVRGIAQHLSPQQRAEAEAAARADLAAIDQEVAEGAAHLAHRGQPGGSRSPRRFV